MTDDSFELYDLRVEVVAPEGAKLWCSAKVGDWFELRGENLFLPEGQSFPLYPLAALLPLLAGQAAPHTSQRLDDHRRRHRLPRSALPGRFRITRTGTTTFRHADVTVVPLPPEPDTGA
jgi:uncharacterized repeat protein (TIGR04076 family)